MGVSGEGVVLCPIAVEYNAVIEMGMKEWSGIPQDHNIIVVERNEGIPCLTVCPYVSMSWMDSDDNGVVVPETA